MNEYIDKNKHIISISSPLHKGVIYKYLVTTNQLEVYNTITRNGTLMSLTLFNELAVKGVLNKRCITNTDRIKL